MTTMSTFVAEEEAAYAESLANKATGKSGKKAKTKATTSEQPPMMSFRWDSFELQEEYEKIAKESHLPKAVVANMAMEHGLRFLRTQLNEKGHCVPERSNDFEKGWGDKKIVSVVEGPIHQSAIVKRIQSGLDR